ncbi:uncharacterized protein UBRO_20314 [Ustilago bromivora]|uniref:Uncharacterized protein n=1 Tax=Ustilago bromivora TaxID=307758 RepID=A0A1K0FYC7_9BASI|nr:uncharacterized protein UBRO_20314 [Ustilago bromivora]
MTTTTDDSLDISAQLFWQSATPTSFATQTRNIPVPSRSRSTSAPDIYTSCPNQVSGSATGKKNFTWSSADVLHLVTIIYDKLIESNPGNKLHKHPIFREVFKLIFPGTPVEPNHIKAKLRWVQETYYKEKKKLSLTGAGTLLEDMDASNRHSSILLQASKITNLNFTSDDKAGMPPYGSAEIPMDLSGSEPYDHGAHGHGLPPILDLMDSTNPPAAVASTSGGSIARPSFSAAGGLDVFESSSSSSSAPLSPGTKCKRGALDHKHDMLAEAFYCSSIDTLQICLQLEQEWTRHERILEAECTKCKEMHMQHEREEKEHDEHIHMRDCDMVMEMVCLLASQASGEKDTCQNTSNNNNMDSSFNLPAL